MGSKFAPPQKECSRRKLVSEIPRLWPGVSLSWQARRRRWHPRLRALSYPAPRCAARNYWRARARGSDTMETAMGAGTDSALSAPARGGVTIDKLANAKSPSAAPVPATKAALIGIAG
jgi:hypothetical protein